MKCYMFFSHYAALSDALPWSGFAYFNVQAHFSSFFWNLKGILGFEDSCF